MKEGIYVRCTKIDRVNDAKFDTANKEDWKYGEYNPTSPFIDYSLTGTLIYTPEQGKNCIYIDRDTRNGEKVPGIFRSSLIEKIEGNKYYTQNSVYILEEIPRPVS